VRAGEIGSRVVARRPRRTIGGREGEGRRERGRLGRGGDGRRGRRRVDCCDRSLKRGAGKKER